MILNLFSFFEFLFYHILITATDRISRLPRNSSPPEFMRLYRENMALKAQIRALVLELKVKEGKRPRVSMRVRAAQVFAYLLTRDDKAFQNYYLSASKTAIKHWAARFRRGPFRRKRRNDAGKFRVSEEVIAIIIQLKEENPIWGGQRISDELRRMGIRCSEPTVQKILREHGYPPRPGHGFNLERFRSTAKDMMWALDFFAVKMASGAWVKVLLVIDLYTREIIELTAFEFWEPTSEWTIGRLASAIHREKRQPQIVIHDHGSQFEGQFERQLRVLEIDQRRTPCALPFVNGQCERGIKSVRLELLNHVRVKDVEELQWYLDEYKEYATRYRANQAIEGFTPAEYAESIPRPEVIKAKQIRSRRLVKRTFAHGLLNAYELIEEPPDEDLASAA